MTENSRTFVKVLVVCECSVGISRLNAWILEVQRIQG